MSQLTHDGNVLLLHVQHDSEREHDRVNDMNDAIGGRDVHVGDLSAVQVKLTTWGDGGHGGQGNSERRKSSRKVSLLDSVL